MRPVLAALEQFVRDGAPLVVPSLPERWTITIGKVAGLRAALEATFELVDAALARQRFDRHVASAALCLMAAGVDSVEGALLAAYAAHEAR